MIKQIVAATFAITLSVAPFAQGQNKTPADQLNEQDSKQLASEFSECAAFYLIASKAFAQRLPDQAQAANGAANILVIAASRITSRQQVQTLVQQYVKHIDKRVRNAENGRQVVIEYRDKCEDLVTKPAERADEIQKQNT